MAPERQADLEQPLLPPPKSEYVDGAPTAADADECVVEEAPPHLAHSGTAGVGSVTTALLSLQCGFGFYLFPAAYGAVGWVAQAVLVVLAALTAYSGTLFTRLYLAVPGTVLFSDVGRAAAGGVGSALVSLIIYSLDATRCVILHLAAAQSLAHTFPAGHQPPLWQCGAAVLVGGALLVQVRSMAEMSWVFIAGTASQLVAVSIVLVELITNPDPEAHTEAVAVTSAAQLAPAAVAVMNMIFAFGGQFAFTEIMGSMKQPRHFTRAVVVCTIIMTGLYGGLGTVGYWSRGSSLKGIVVFALPNGRRARLAAACVLVQASAQYLINVNVWTHNLLVIIARALAKPREEGGPPIARCSSDHCKWRWLGVSVFVVSYSYFISISLPFFSTLVGLMTSVTYLACAYTLPAWFTLKLLGARLGCWEKAFLIALIPLSLAGSGVGLWGSVLALLNDLGGGEGFGR